MFPVSLSSASTVPLFVDVDPVLVVMIVFLLLLIFGVYLFIRKTLLNFSEGMREGRNR